MASRGLPTSRAIGGCLLKQPIISCPSLTRRTIYDTPSTVGGTHGAPSTLRANDDTRTKFVAGKSTTGIMASQREVKLPGPSQPRLQLVAPPGDGRGTTTTTLLPRTNIIINDRRTCAEYQHLLRASGPFNGPLTSRSPTSTNMNLSRIREVAWSSTPPLPRQLGQPRT
jgi:hypothetical protein